MNNMFADREQCVFWIQIVSGIDHSGPAPKVTCTLLTPLLRRRPPVDKGPDHPKISRFPGKPTRFPANFPFYRRKTTALFSTFWAAIDCRDGLEQVENEGRAVLGFRNSSSETVIAGFRVSQDGSSDP